MIINRKWPAPFNCLREVSAWKSRAYVNLFKFNFSPIFKHYLLWSSSADWHQILCEASWEGSLQGMTLTFPSTNSCHSDEWSKISLARNDNQLVHAVRSYIILLNCRGDYWVWILLVKIRTHPSQTTGRVPVSYPALPKLSKLCWCRNFVSRAPRPLGLLLRIFV